jgi:hypothetical protein
MESRSLTFADRVPVGVGVDDGPPREVAVEVGEEGWIAALEGNAAQRSDASHIPEPTPRPSSPTCFLEPGLTSLPRHPRIRFGGAIGKAREEAASLHPAASDHVREQRVLEALGSASLLGEDIKGNRRMSIRLDEVLLVDARWRSEPGRGQNLAGGVNDGAVHVRR